MKTLLNFLVLFLFTYSLFSQTNCTPIPEVNFPGGRVIMTFDGNVHDDDDIVALPMSVGLWWAAGLKDRVVQVEYNNHVCNTNVNENDGSGAGSGDDSQNMRNSTSGSLSRFGYNSSIFYDYENQGNASTNKMASEIEKSTSSNPLWIIAGGPMETIWRGLEQATRGHGNVTIISHSNWNEKHTDCAGDHTWADIKNKYQGKGVYFVGFCTVSSGCNGPSTLGDQNNKLSASLGAWNWMKTSNHEYNRYIYTRNPFGSEKFDPSDAGMSYFLISGGPFKNGKKQSTISDFEKLLENPCVSTSKPPTNTAPTLSFTNPGAISSVQAGSNISVDISASDNDGSVVKHQIYLNGNLVHTKGASYTPYTISNIKAGSYTVKATVTDDDGANATKSISFTAKTGSTTNPPPSSGDTAPALTIVSPSNNQNFTVGSAVTVDLSTSDSNGSVMKHQVYRNGNLVDTDGSSYSPYKIASISKGTHTIKVTITDNDGEKTTKSITITAGSGSGSGSTSTPPPPSSGNAPIVTIKNPADGQNFAVGNSFAVTLSASDPNGKIVKHQIFVNGKLVDTDGSTYSSYKFNRITKGTHTIEAVVTDNSGLKTSESISITAGGATNTGGTTGGGNKAPVVNILNPKNGQNFSTGSDISVKISSSDGDGNVVKHQIFINNTLVDTDGTSYTPHTINNVKSGSYTVRAKVTDNNGATAVNTISFTVGGSTTKSATSATGVSPKAGEPQEIGLSTEMEEPAFLTIAPNPVQDKTLHIYQNGHKYMRIVDLSGSILRKMVVDEPEVTLNIGDFKPGIYILIAGEESIKFMVE